MTTDPRPQETASGYPGAAAAPSGSASSPLPIPSLRRAVNEVLRRWQRRYDRAFDRAFDVDTDRRAELADLADFDSKASGERYFPVGVLLFKRILAILRLNYQDYVFIDVGAGKGRAVLLASSKPFKEIIGVEHAPELHQIMSSNVRRYRAPRQRCRALSAVCLDAAHFPIPDGPCVFFFHNPLKNAALTAVIENIKASYLRQPRHIIVLYLNPARRNQVREILAGAGIFAMRRCRDPIFSLLSRLPLVICSTAAHP
jgi:hypothetical protein